MEQAAAKVTGTGLVTNPLFAERLLSLAASMEHDAAFIELLALVGSLAEQVGVHEQALQQAHRAMASMALVLDRLMKHCGFVAPEQKPEEPKGRPS